MKAEELRNFYTGRRVLVTGHTGFKGAWMCELLLSLGAEVTGYALTPPTEPSLFALLGLKDRMHSEEGDIRDLPHLLKVFSEVRPEVVIHMAAQPIVRESYKDPVYTYDVNVMGTVNMLECVRLTDSVYSVVNVTTDKVYKNFEWERGYREEDILCGFDPYSNSKSCSELVTASYKNSFFGGETGMMADGRKIAVSTCRAGNVLGGGDFAKDRIIPDCIRAVREGKTIVVRNPYSTRPYQHVLEPVTAYLIVAMEQYKNRTLSGNYNIGPDDADCICTGDLVDLFCRKWNQDAAAKGLSRAAREDRPDGGPHEAGFLKLDSRKIKETFSISDIWHIEEVMEKIVEWSEVYLSEGDIRAVTNAQIQEYLEQK